MTNLFKDGGSSDVLVLESSPYEPEIKGPMTVVSSSNPQGFPKHGTEWHLHLSAEDQYLHAAGEPQVFPGLSFLKGREPGKEEQSCREA